MAEEQQLRTVPTSGLDMGMLLTDPVWGTPYVSPELRERLTRLYEKNRGKGAEAVEMSLWGLMSSYTRDIRLGNLSRISGELQYCQYHIDLANHFLQEGYVKPFLLSLGYAATILELSQSKGGFLRKILNTFREEKRTITEEPKKRRLTGRDE